MITKTFTFGETPHEIIEDALPFKYDMKLNRSDMMVLLDALYRAWSDAEGYRAEEFSTMRTDILSTIGIEEI